MGSLSCKDCNLKPRFLGCFSACVSITLPLYAPIDGDYIFKSDLISECEWFRGEDILLHKKVKMLPAANITTNRIKNWSFPPCKFNVWGTLANGAMQYATKQFFARYIRKAG